MRCCWASQRAVLDIHDDTYKTLEAWLGQGLSANVSQHRVGVNRAYLERVELGALLTYKMISHVNMLLFSMIEGVIAPFLCSAIVLHDLGGRHPIKVEVQQDGGELAQP